MRLTYNGLNEAAWLEHKLHLYIDFSCYETLKIDKKLKEIAN